MPDKDDWRRQGQERYLKGVTLSFKQYTSQRADWDHDHCEFCGAKLMETSNDETLTEGYATDNNYRWVCQQCFDDFESEYKWKVENSV
jgi:uncharacterized protein with PIN domain